MTLFRGKWTVAWKYLSNPSSSAQWQASTTKQLMISIMTPSTDWDGLGLNTLLILSFSRYNIVFPCMMMSTLTVLVFCLPPDSGEKIGLGITVLLAFSVFMLAIAEKMPETSESIPLIGKQDLLRWPLVGYGYLLKSIYHSLVRKIVSISFISSGGKITALV